MNRLDLLFVLFFFVTCFQVCGQTHDLSFYRDAAHKNNPTLKENLKQQQYTLLQKDLITAQFKKPVVNITADYLFAPYFFNNGQFISVTTTPNEKAFGYDAALSNGGLYAAQLNVGMPLLNGKIVKVFNSQVDVQDQLLQNENKQLIHELDKTVTDIYITAFQSQQEMLYLQQIKSLVLDRKKIVEALVTKGILQQNDYLLLEIEINALQFDIQQQQIVLAQALSNLNTTCGIYDSINYTLSTPDISKNIAVSQYNYQLKFQLDSLNIATQQLVNNTKYKPQLMAFGNAGLNSSNAQYIPHNVGLSAGIHLAIPLYDGGQKKITTNQNRLLQESLQDYLQQSKVEQQNNVMLLDQQITYSNESLKLLETQLKTQETLLNIIKDKVVTGQVSVTDYLNALKDYASQNQNKIQTENNLWLLINEYNYLNW